jgi:putative cell wall-binding protein
LNKGSFARSVAVGAVAALTALAGFAFAPGAGAAANYTQVRLGGVDRFDTAAIIAAQIDEATPTAVLARADIFPDALTGAFAAAANGDGPLLLTRSDSVPARTLQALETENVDEVILLGGTAAISSAVETQLRAAGYTVSRIGGATRYDTAANIARDGAGIIGTIDGDRSALLSSGQNFPDALSGAPLSFAAGLPSLLTPPTSLHPSTLSALNSLNIDQVFILGGPAAISQDVEQALSTEGFQVTRLAGGNRSGTSVEVFEFGLDKGIYTNRRFGLARGDAFPDALAYGPLGGRPRATIAPDSGVADTGGSANGLLLSAGPCTLGDEAEEFILANQATWTEGEILGGPEAICEEVADEVEQLASFGLANITLNSSDVQPGGAVSGVITGDNIRSVTVSGCGFNNQTVTRDANGNFTLPNFASTQDDCTLTFTTTFNDGSTEIDQFPINVVQSNEPNVTLNPNSGASGSSTQAQFTGSRPGNITNVTTNTPGCTVTQTGTQANNRTFTVTGSPGQTCNIQTTVTYTDAQGGTQTFNDTFTINGGTTPPPPPSGGTTGVGAGPQLRTAGPDLLAVTIINGIPNDAVPNQVRFTYDEAVLNPVVGDFSLGGPDSDTGLVANAASIDSADPNSVIAQFTDATDLRTFTIGTSDEGAVTDGANFSVTASKPLGGSSATTTSGRTAAPDLVSATPNVTAQEVTYCFDQPINNAAIDPTDFGFYTDSGARSQGTAFTAPSGTQNCVTVQFQNPVTPANQPVESAKRFFVEDDSAAPGDSAVRDLPGALDNPLGHEPQAATTIRPDLISASKVAGQPSQVDFTFDENVTIAGASANAFAVYQDDGTRFDGDVVAQNGPATVRVTFNNPGNELNQNNIGQIVLAGVEESAVFSAAAATEGNTVGDAPLAGGANTGAGFTDGPDLIGATFNTTSNQVTFNFDEPVADAAAGAPAAAPNERAFFVVDAAGVATCGNAGSATVSGNNVTITFAGGVASAAGAGVNAIVNNTNVGARPIGEAPNFPAAGAQANCLVVDAVTDFLGNGNSPDSVGGGGAPAS